MKKSLRTKVIALFLVSVVMCMLFLNLLCGVFLRQIFIYDTRKAMVNYSEQIEKDIENALVQDVTNLLLELGTGFAFVGNQYHLNVAGDDFYIDLLFYNINLHCYMVIELKTGEFKPEYAGKLNFYLSAVDDIVKTDQDNPSIGLLLCKSKKQLDWLCRTFKASAFWSKNSFT